MNDERRYANRWQNRTDVDLRVHLEQCGRSSWAGGYTQVAGPPVLHSRVARNTWRQYFELRRASPSPLDALDVPLPLVGGRSPRIVRRTYAFGIRAVEDERSRPLRIRRREQRAHDPAFRCPEESRRLGSGRIHNGSDIIHAVVQSGQPVHAHPIR